MDETSKIIKEYASKLPPAIKKVVLLGEWQKKVEAIGQKYSLDTKKISDLQYEVIFVLIGMELYESLSANIQRNLGVSKIISDEISEEVGEKVISNIIDQAEKEDGKKNMIFPKKIENALVKTPEKPRIPEIRPETTPMVENNPPKVGVPRYVPTQSKPGQINGASRINYSKTPVVEPTPKPVDVPRPASPTTPSPTPQTIQPQPKSIIDEKLNSVTSGIVEEKPKTETPINKSYSVDPYREPLA